MWNTEAEKKALIEKYDNPQKTVLCPTCGKPIEFIEVGNSINIKCSGCGVSAGIRGF